MSRIFWDTMLFIYLLEDSDQRTERVTYLLERSRERGDDLFTSYLAVGEVMAGAGRVGGAAYVDRIPDVLREMGFRFLPFDGGAVGRFGNLRGIRKIKVADAIHLACAGSAGIDLFFTGDEQLLRLDVPGVQFIVGIDAPIL